MSLRLHFDNQPSKEVTFSPPVSAVTALEHYSNATAEPIVEKPIEALDLHESCDLCVHRSRFGNCLQPVEAGITEKYELVRHPTNGRGCKVITPDRSLKGRVLQALISKALDKEDAALCLSRYDDDPVGWDTVLELTLAAVNIMDAD